VDFEELKKVVAHQADMPILWQLPLDRKSSTQELALMSALSHIRYLVEGDEHTAQIAKELYWNLEEKI